MYLSPLTIRQSPLIVAAIVPLNFLASFNAGTKIVFLISLTAWGKSSSSLRACLHGGGGRQVDEVTR